MRKIPSKDTNRILYKKCAGVKSIFKIILKIFKNICNMIEKALQKPLLKVKRYNTPPKKDDIKKQKRKIPSLNIYIVLNVIKSEIPQNKISLI